MTPSADTSAHQLADHLFRHESGRMISTLVGLYGSHRLQLAEDVVQESLVRALNSWPYRGIPENPAAWLMRTAKNLAIDQLRRESNFQRKQPEIVAASEPDEPGAISDDDGSVEDDQLRLMFICCHPVLPAESRTALALKTLCGFSPAEIARAFLITEGAVAKRLTRARQRVKQESIPFEIPADSELPARLDGVLEIIYLLFNEGYKATSGEEIIRLDLCSEAIRLGKLLADHPVGDSSRTHALLALMCLNGARLPARVDQAGNLLRLEDQDRSLWDPALTRRGVYHLVKSTGGDQVSDYHLQAGIAAYHTMAPDDDHTDWKKILLLYNTLQTVKPSPIVELNRAVAVSKVHGPAAAIRGLENSGAVRELEDNHLLHAVLGELHLKQGDKSEAVTRFTRALELSETKPERAFLERRIKEIQ